MKQSHSGTYLKDIGYIAAIFIFLILFLAVVNFFVSIRLRAEIQQQTRDRVITLSHLCLGYLERFGESPNRQYLMLNLKAAFDAERMIVADAEGKTIYDSSSDLPGITAPAVFDFRQSFPSLPPPGQVIIRGNEYLYFDHDREYIFYAAFTIGYSNLGTLFTWHLIYLTMSLIFVSFLGIYLIRNLFLPMRYAARVARQYGVALRREDFIAETFNELLEKMKNQERLLTDFAAYIAHEFRNSIATIAGHARLAEKGKKESAIAIADECREMERLIAGLLDYARPMRLILVPVDLSRLIEEVQARSSVPAGVKIIIRNKEPVVIQGDIELLTIAVGNLVRNAVEAVAGSGTVIIETDRTAEAAYFSVQDTGPGVPENERERIFSPFYSSKETGIGLGLALVKKVVEMHNARIEVEAPAAGGSRFIIKFPSPG